MQTEDREDLIERMPSGSGVLYDGLIKLKLVHAHGATVFLPDILLTDIDGWKWFQPQFFTPCLLTFLDGQSYAQMAIDIAKGPQVRIGFTDDRLVRRFEDGAQLYRCRIAAPVDLVDHASGTCGVTQDTIDLDLFHHTRPETVALIQESHRFLGSHWNIQGTRELANFAYAYFTSVPAIASEADLQSIAMRPKARCCCARQTQRRVTIVSRSMCIDKAPWIVRLLSESQFRSSCLHRSTSFCTNPTARLSITKPHTQQSHGWVSSRVSTFASKVVV